MDSSINTFLLRIFFCVLSVSHSFARSVNTYKYATCTIIGDSSSSLHGTVNFRQALSGQLTDIKISLTGMPDSGTKHEIAITEFGDISDQCKHVGVHYNPLHVSHGGRLQSPFQRHVGDLGNIIADSNGQFTTEFKDYLVQLDGPYSVIGRSFVVYKEADDVDTLTSSHDVDSGKPLACCTIGISDGWSWENTGDE